MKNILNLIFCSLFLIFLFSCSSTPLSQSKKEKPLIEIRFYLVDSSKSPDSIVLNNQKGDKVYLKLPPFLTEEDFAFARLTDGMYRKYDIRIELTPEGTKKMEDTSRLNLKKQAAIAIDGQIIMMPYFQQEIKGNAAIITGEPEEDKTRAIVEKINRMIEERKK